MVCIYCHGKTSVVNSRPQKKTNSIWRRRSCELCGAVSTSIEQYELLTALMVKKRSGALEGFQRDKLIISVAKAIDHKKNSSQAASYLTNTILQKLLKKPLSNKIITTLDISHMASSVLKYYDAGSAIRYASYKSPTKAPKDIRNILK
jgi:transcriptional regulator NrdR family protein